MTTGSCVLLLETAPKNVALTLCLPLSLLPPPGFLHTPDGSHLAPTLSRHSPPVFSAPWAGHRGGSAHPPGAHSHCAGKAATASLKKGWHTSASPLTPSLLLALLLLSFVFDLPFLSSTSYTGLVFMSCIKRLHFSRLSVVVKPPLLIFVRDFSGLAIHALKLNWQIYRLSPLQRTPPPTASFTPPFFLFRYTEGMERMCCCDGLRFACGFSWPILPRFQETAAPKAH